jgi:predicted nucleic acid-binding protein
MRLAVIDPVVFAGGVFWRHEPHLCLKAWLRGILTPVLTEEILAEYEAILEQLKQEHHFTTDAGPWLDAMRTSALWVEWKPIAKRVCQNSADEKLIEAALGAKCRTLIVRKRDVMPLEKPFGIDVLTPQALLDTLTRRQRRLLSGSHLS